MSPPGITARYRLLEPLRQYLAEHLAESDEVEMILRAHGEWVAGLCERLDARLFEDQKACSRRLGEERDNIELALRWAHDHDRALAFRIVGALGHFWFLYDQVSGRRWCYEVIKARPGASPGGWAGVLLSAGIVAQNDQDWDRSVAWLREALAIYRTERGAAGQALSLYWLGRALALWRHLEYGQDHALEATRCFEESLSLSTQLGDLVGAGWCRLQLSAQAQWNDDLDRAEQLAWQVFQDCSETGARHPMGEALSRLAYVARRRGHNDAALGFLQDADTIYRDLGDPWMLAEVLVELAATKAAMGRGAEALQALAESLQHDELIGRLPGRSLRLAAAAFIHLDRGQLAMAVSALGAYDAHPAGDASRTRFGGYTGWLAEAIETTRARLDPAEVAVATAAARCRSLEELLDKLIIQPAKAAV